MIALSDDRLNMVEEEHIDLECPSSSMLLFINLIDDAIHVACKGWNWVLRDFDVQLSLKVSGI